MSPARTGSGFAVRVTARSLDGRTVTGIDALFGFPVLANAMNVSLT